MKKTVSVILVLLMAVLSASASASTLTGFAKPVGEWSLSYAKSLVGEEMFDALVAEAKSEILSIVRSELEELGLGFGYSIDIYALIDLIKHDGEDPHRTIYTIGDSSPELTEIFKSMYELGYLSSVPAVYDEDVAYAIRKIQYAALLPVTGDITAVLEKALSIKYAIPDNEKTLSVIMDAATVLNTGTEALMEFAMAKNEVITDYTYSETVGDPAAYVTLSSYAELAYTLAHTYTPLHAAELELYIPITSSLTSYLDTSSDEEGFNATANIFGIFHFVFMGVQYEFSHDAVDFVSEWYDLNK